MCSIYRLLPIIRLKANAVSSFDIGIFSQMFERMRHDFSQVTTLERDKGLIAFRSPYFSDLLFDLALLYAISLCGNIGYRSNSDCLFCSYPALFDPKENTIAKSHDAARACPLFVTPVMTTSGGFHLHENCFCLH